AATQEAPAGAVRCGVHQVQEHVFLFRVRPNLLPGDDESPVLVKGADAVAHERSGRGPGVDVARWIETAVETLPNVGNPVGRSRGGPVFRGNELEATDLDDGHPAAVVGLQLVYKSRDRQ